MLARRDGVRVALLAFGAASAIALGASCASLIGLEPYRASGGGGASASSDHGGAATTANGGSAGSANGGAAGGTTIDGGRCAGACVASPSSRFKGPFLLEDGTTCPSGTAVVTGMLAPTECRECSCRLASTCAVTFTPSKDPMNCAPDADRPFPIAPGCSALAPFSGGTVFKVTVDAIQPIACETAPDCGAPTPSTVSLCPIGEACEGGGTCVPPHARVCFFGDEHSGKCPDQYADIDETLADHVDVSGCSCGLKPTGYDCEPSVLGFAQTSDCTDPPTPIDIGSCVIPHTGFIDYQPMIAPTCLAPAPQVKNSPPFTHVCCGP